MAEASIFSSKPKLRDINKYHQLDDEWYSLGIELEIDDKELEILEEKYSADPHKRLIKMFGVWLEKGENPTYRKLVEALVEIDKKNIAQAICMKLGLTSSLDDLLSAIPPVKLSECSPDASIDTQASVSVADKHVQSKSSTIHDRPIPLPDSSHLLQFKNDSADTLDIVDHSEDKSNKSLTVSSPQIPVAHCANVQVKSSSDTDDQTLTYTDSSCQEYSTNDQTIIVSASIDSLASTVNDPHQIMLRCNDKLIKALSLDPQDIAEVLLAKGLIPENTEAQMRQCSTPHEKATILVTTVRQRIKIAPKQFCEFLDILSKQEWTQDILEILQSYSSIPPHERDVHLQLRNTDDLSLSKSKPAAKAISGGSEYTVSPSSEEYTFPTLNPDDVAELEAQLITSAESMKKKFAALLWKTIESFKHQVISPQTIINGVLAVTEYEDPSIGKPLLEREKEALAKARSIDAIFNILRPHMTFFNYEILEFLIETIGSNEDKDMLQQYLHDFQCFCRRSVFEVPKSIFGHSSEKVVQQQYFHVKITKTFKAAFLSECTSESEPSLKKICAPDLGISLENAKHVQQKIALLLKLKISSLYLDSVSAGSTILTFLIPLHISLAGLDSDPDIIALASNGIHILCGPPGKPEPKHLTSKGLVVQWSQPEYGNSSLAKYILYYQKKCSETKPLNEWQKLELSSLETQTCVPDLSGDMYVFKICTVSDVGTLQCSDKSDPIVVSADGMLRKNIHKVIVANKDVLNLTFLSANPNTIAVMLSTEGVISKEDETQISLASSLSEKAVVLVSAIARSAPEKQNFLDILSKAKISLTGDVMEALWSDYYDTVYQLYLDYLKCLYASLEKKQTSSNQWPPSATKKFFRLAMIKNATVQRGKIEDRFVQMTITGKVDDILRKKYPIQIENIFKQTRGEKKVILLEGAPGCGKSTLSVYICQQWEKGELFNQFELVILIQLRDPAIRNAKDLVDLLPCPDATTAQQIATRMLAKKGRDVLFILDGWDELPSNLQSNSIFHQLVQPKSLPSDPLCKSTVIITSRPIASGYLHQIVSSRVEILGFTAEEPHQFFTECLKGDTEAVKTLLERIKENPEVAGSCYLPLNATILVHLFKNDQKTLCTTLYGIFLSLILNYIKRHLKLRTPQYNDLPIESLDQLPEFAKKPFLVLCQLAYDGVMEDKIVFTSLPADIDTLSLLQGVESFIGRDKAAVSHNFIHLSIQELLAAWYIANQLPASEQVSKFNELFNKSCFSAVFRFYAAITKLMAPGIKEVVTRVVKKNDGVHMTSILHCLYEAQDPSLCESVAQQLQCRLCLLDTTLTPSDCLSIGYFLAHVCKMTAGEFKVDLSNCSISDQCCKYLVSGLHTYLDTHSAMNTLLKLDMRDNDFSHHGVRHLLMLGTSGCVNVLNLSNNHLVSKHDMMHTFDAFTSLKNNTSLKVLWLVKCYFNSQSAENLSKALTTCKYLEELYLGNNALRTDGIQHLAHALLVNQSLKKLYLNNCEVRDEGVEYLATSLPHNRVLKQLRLNSNYLTENIVPTLTKYLPNNHTLTELWLSKDLASSTTSIETAVNDVRRRSGLPLITVKV